jgi:DNA-binding transcriptional LysR family regulator
MNFRQLRYFCEVADSGTLARAAERLFVAPTAISMQIAQLEEGLGGMLFDRTARPMKLTPLGLFFLPRARELLANGQRLEEETRDVASGKSGWLGIGFVRSLLNSRLPSALHAFRQAHPEVKLELVEMLSEHQPAQLRSGRIHLGLSRFALAPEPVAELRHTPLFEDPFVVALSAQHPLARRRRLTVVDLDGLPLISYPKDPHSGFAQRVLAALLAAGAQPRVDHEAIEIHTALALVAAGLGYAIVGASVAERGQRDVVFLPIPALKTRTVVMAVTRVGEDNPLVDRMLALLQSAAPAAGRRGRTSEKLK